MRLWRDDSFYVRKFRTLLVMRWPYRMLFLSGVLAPVTFSLATCFDHSSDDRLYWPWLAASFWLYVGIKVLVLIRGYRANQRGIPPAQPGQRPDHLEIRSWLIRVCVILVGIVCVLFVLGKLPSVQDRGFIISSIALSAVMVSYHTEERFWNVSL